IREVAISSWALVIFLIELIPRIRERSSRKVAIGGSHSLRSRRYRKTAHGSPGLLLDVLAGDRQRLDLFVGQFAGFGLVHHAAAVGRQEALLELVGGRLDLLGRLVLQYL